MSVSYRPLGIISAMVEEMQLEVTYAYEDLVFISHNAFLLRMGEKGELVHLYFNQESEMEDRSVILKTIRDLAVSRKLEIIDSGTYTMEPRDDDQLDIRFVENVQQGA